jgi:PleD family two-component response regulator
MLFSGREHMITLSLGIAGYEPGLSGSELVRSADTALYGAKRDGGNRVLQA